MTPPDAPDAPAALEVAMIGPDLDAMGGIATVCRTWLGTEAIRAARVRHVGTMRDAPPARKAVLVAARQARFAARLARGWRPDLFHVHTSYRTSFYRKLAYVREALATGRPVVVHVHAPDLRGFYEASRLNAAAVRWMFARAARVVALSEHMAGEIRGWMGDAARVEVLYNPVDTRRFRPAPRPADRPPTLLFMGRIEARKGVWDLLEALPAVLAAVPGARARFCGDGERERLLAEARRLGIADRVEAPGWLSGDAALEAWASADLLCLPSYHEGLPMSILEAMACGLPVVATPIAGVPEAVVEGRTGHLVPPGDREALAERLVALLGDPERRAAFGREARRRAETVFDAEVVVGRLVELWRAVAREGGADAAS